MTAERRPQGRLADRAYAAIVEQIGSDAMQVGDRLASETNLAKVLGMSRTIVREALVRLASDGITEARRGAGSFVKRLPSTRLRSHVAMQDLSAALGSYEVRFVLEAEGARLAAVRRTPEQMEKIEQAMERLRTALHSTEPAHMDDLALHQAILAATANPAFLSAFEHLRGEIEPILRAGVDIFRSRSARAVEIMVEEHEAVVDAIRVQDGEAAALAMRWHLWQGRKRLMP